MWTTKQKVTLGLSLAVIVLGGISGTYAYGAHQHKQEVSDVKQAIKKESATLEEIEKEVMALRDAKNPNFLAKDVTVEQTEQLAATLSNFEKKRNVATLSETKKEQDKLASFYETVVSDSLALDYQYGTQVMVNNLFQTKDAAVINGTNINKEAAIIDDLTLDAVNKVSKQVRDEGKDVLIPESTTKETWEQTIDGLIKEAETQVNVIEEAKKEVASLFKDKKPVDTTDKKKIEALDKKINSIKNGKAKKELADQLKQVKEAVDKKAKADAEKKANEQAKAEAQAAATTPAPATQVSEPVAEANNETATYDYSGSQAGGQSYQGSNNYSAPQGNTGGGGGSYTPPATNNNTNNQSSGGNGGSTPPGYDGHATQEELDQQEIDASTSDWSDFITK